MTYIVPYFRYGALIFHNIKNIHEKKPKNSQQDNMQRLLNQTMKRVNDLPMSTPNVKLNKVMGN